MDIKIEYMPDGRKIINGKDIEMVLMQYQSIQCENKDAIVYFFVSFNSLNDFKNIVEYLENLNISPLEIIMMIKIIFSHTLSNARKMYDDIP